MTRTMQDKLLGDVEQRVIASGLDAVKDARWSNQGRLLVQEGYVTVLAIGFSFQSGYCSLSMTGGMVDNAIDSNELVDAPPTHRVANDQVDWHHLEYQDSERIADFLATLQLLLPVTTSTRTGGA